MAAAGTAAGAPVAATVGRLIPLGNGAKLTFVAVSGQIIGGGPTVAVTNENDRSMAVLVQYGGFDYLWASDLGGGDLDNACTGRSTSNQVDVESSVVQAISPGGASPMISARGIDVLAVNHHGSESSTNANLLNASAPAVAVISTGAGQNANWNLPRKDVVEKVLLAQATACVTAPAAALVLQTEEGAPTGANTSFAGRAVGNIKISVDGLGHFTVSADGAVSQGPNELAAAGLPRTFNVDDIPATTDLDLSNWRIVQADSALTFTLPAQTKIAPDGYVIVARNASKAAFEAFWRGGTPLPANVVYVDAGGSFPVINGSERYRLRNAGGTVVDGIGAAMTAGGLQSIQRKDPCLAPGPASSWNFLGTSAATPGTGAGPGCAKGVVINEFSDASGTGNFKFEFVELHFDK